MPIEPEKAAHDAWFRAKVQEALDDPRPAIPNEKVEAYFAARKAELLTASNKPKLIRRSD